MGIEPEAVKKLFQFFGKLKEQKKVNQGGMGFGLTISKMIVQQLKGTISAQSVVNKGSTFTFEITAKAQRRKNRGNAAIFEELEELESVPTQEDC